MTVKLFGAILILFSGSSVGWIISTQYLMRVKELQELQMAINIFDTEISYGQTILPEALKLTAMNSNGNLVNIFQDAADELLKAEGKTFAEVWQKVLKEYYSAYCLQKEDWQILKEWGQQVGKSDLTAQSKVNKRAIKRLEELEYRAQKYADRRVKLIRYSGVLLSLLVIIIFY